MIDTYRMTSYQSYPPPPPPKAWEGTTQMPTFHRQNSLPHQAQQPLLRFPSSDPNPMSATPASTTTQPAVPHHTHTRSSSFFSFLSSKQHDSPPPQRKQSNQENTSTSGPGTRQNAPTSPLPQPLPSPQITPMHQPHSPTTPSTSTAVNPVSQSPTSPKHPQPPQPTPLHPEIRSVVSLTVAHAHKIYFSGPLIRRIERQPDGQKPSKDEGWIEVWAQLGGTTLSIWDMREIQEASRQGKEVPPTYVNVTDAFVQVLGSVTVPATATQPSKRYTNVLTLNTAGSNLLLFSCPSTSSLISWASALRLSAWEKSRLEEIYTAHLIRITLNRPDLPTTLIRGKMEGWVRIRVAGQTDWKRVWMVVSAGREGVGIDNATSGAPSSSVPKKKRMSNLFSRDQSPPRPTGPEKPTITMYGGPKPKEKKKPWLSLRDITQAFAVYPERPELITRSTLIKLEGLLGDEEMAQSMKSREGWILFMPEMEGTTGNHAMEMLKWVIGVHDAFELYGRPATWTWDPRESHSLMFAYPVGPQRDLLFLDREAVEGLDPRDDRTSAIRSKLLELLTERMRQQQPQLVQQRSTSAGRPSSEQPPSLPPISIGNDPSPQQQQNGTSTSAAGPQLPPLSFSGVHKTERTLTPITEGGSIMTHGRNLSVDATNVTSPATASVGPSTDKPGSPGPLLDRGFTGSPVLAPTSPSHTTHINVAATSGIASSDAPARPPAQSVKSSTSIDRATGAASPLSQKPSQPRPSTSASNNSQSQSGAKLEVPSMSVASASDKSTASNANGSNALSPTSIGSLISPYSPLEKPTGMAFTESAGSASSDRPKSAASFLTSPYSHHDHTPADRMSVLTSPHSLHELQDRGGESGDYRAFGQAGADLHAAKAPSPSKFSIANPTPTTSATRPAPARKMSSPTTHEPEDSFLGEAGALFLMHQSRLESGGDAAMGIGLGNKPRQVPMPTTSSDEDEDDSDSSEEFKKPNAGNGDGPSGSSPPAINNSRSPPLRQGTPMAFMERSQQPSTPPISSATNISTPAAKSASPGTSPRIQPQSSSPKNPPTTTAMMSGTMGTSTVAPLRLNPSSNPASDRANVGSGPLSANTSSRAGLGRKPSGARAQATSRMPPYNGTNLPSSHQQLTEEEETSDEKSMQASIPTTTPPRHAHPATASIPGSGTSAGANVPLSSPVPSQPKPAFVKNFEVEGDIEEPNDDVLAAISYLNVADDEQGSATGGPKVEPLKVATHKGIGDRERPPLSASSTSESGSGLQFKSSFAPSTSAAKRKAKVQAQQAAHLAAQHKPGRANGKKSKAADAWDDSSDEEEEDEEDEEDDDADSDAEPLPPRMRGSPSGHPQNAQAGRPSVYGQFAGEGGQPSHLRAPRTLPQPPTGRPGIDDQHLGQSRRLGSDQFSEPRRTYYEDGTQIRSQSEFPQPGTARQTVWSQVLDSGRNVNPVEQSNTRDTFVQLDTAETMTKAFTPQGLLSAGLQDKQDRSAKRQEELARETGASLINVPNKPPPPQTGLLGAITAHERERKREGGVGAALTEREREKRLAEERQRRFDEQQRQQMEQMQQSGSMYGGYGFNPMMNPMMMGMNPMMMNPMMTGGGMAPMMTGGGMNPMMTGGGMNPMMGYPGMLNPQQMFAAQQAAAAAYQQAMMAFSTAGSQVGGENGNSQGNMQPMGQNMTGGNMPGFDPRMSMMGMPMMGGMNMGMGMAPTMTGNFDSRFPPGNGGSPGATGGENGGLLPPTGPGQFSSQTSSPVGRGSPLARPADGSERPATPKH